MQFFLSCCLQRGDNSVAEMAQSLPRLPRYVLAKFVFICTIIGVPSPIIQLVVQTHTRALNQIWLRQLRGYCNARHVHDLTPSSPPSHISTVFTFSKAACYPISCQLGRTPITKRIHKLLKVLDKTCGFPQAK
jgi:hypothetical protein